jgi:hypothetical protein
LKKEKVKHYTDSKMLLVHSITIPDEYLERIADLFPGIESFALSESDKVYRSIASHPDIFIFQGGNNTIIYADSISRALINKLEDRKLMPIPSTISPSGSYPKTAVLNAAEIGNYIIANFGNISPAIADYSKNCNRLPVNTRQGYSRCSVVPVGDNALITADEDILKAASKAGIDCCSISPGHVMLPGERYGFLGGACGVLPDKSIIFLGDIRLHPDYEKMKHFFEKHNISYSYLDGLALFDAGSLVFIN